MNLIFPAATQRATSGGVGALVRWIGMCAGAVVAHWERRAAIKALLERDDRELRDIGIARCHIEAAVGGALNPAMGSLDESRQSRSGKPRVRRES
jgi:uncharacterized protein YjiS (DUF1127 family)